MDLRRVALFLSLGALGCGTTTPAPPPNSLATHPLQLVPAENAVVLPLRAFAMRKGGTPDDCGSGLPLAYAAIELAPDALYVDGEPLGIQMEQGAFLPGERRGLLLNQLYERLLTASEQLRDDGLRGCTPWRLDTEPAEAPGRLLFTVDARMPWETVEPVVYTAVQARFGDLHLRVTDSTPDPWSPSAAPPAVVLRPSPRMRASEVLHEVDVQAGLAGAGAVIGFEPIGDAEVLAAAGDSAGEGEWLAADAQVAVLRVFPTEAWRTAGLPKAAAKAPGAAAATGSTEERVPDDILATLKTVQSQLQACYAKVAPQPEGSIRAYFMVLPDGSPSNVKVSTDDLGSGLGDCLRDRIATLRFTKRSEPALFTVPLSFKP